MKGQKKSVGLISKTQLCTCITLFLYISLPLICTTTTWNFQKLPCYTFYGGNVVCVPACSLFFAPVIFTSVAANISHFLTTAIKFSGFSSNKIGLPCFLSLALALSLLFTSMKRLKLSQKKKSALLLFFLSLKIQEATWFTNKKARVLEMQSFTLAYIKGWTYIRTILSKPKFLECIYITKFSYTWCSAARALCTQELRYNK